ncbi:MAG: TonB family protein [Sphingorhabdus sp.]
MLSLVCIAGLMLPAGSAAARDYGSVAGWQLASSGESCGLYSSKAGSGEIIILKRLDGAMHLQVSSEFWRIGDGSEVRYNIDGREWKGDIGVAPVKEVGRKGYLAAFAPEFASLLRGGKQLAVKDGDRTLGIYSLRGSARALFRMDSCLADLRRSGPETADIAAISQPKPTNGAGRWFSLNDYPRKAQQQGREGTVVFRLTVGTNGRVSKCEIVGSSGHHDIDASTCKAVSKRARFDAAVGADGEKVEGQYESRVTWRVPS